MLTDADIVLVNNTSNGQKPFRMSYGSYKRLKEKSKYRNTLEIVAETVEPVQKKRISDVEAVDKPSESNEGTEVFSEENPIKLFEAEKVTDEQVSTVKFSKAAEKLIEEKGIDRAVFIGVDKVGIQDVRNKLQNLN